MTDSARSRRRALVALALAAAAGLGLAGCGRSERAQQADREEIERLLHAYLPALGVAYRTGDTSGLAGLAAPKEAFATDKKIVDMAREGRVLQPTFKSMTIEHIDVYQFANAYVTTVEVWDLRVVSAGSEQVLSEQLDQTNRVRYQLKRGDDGWHILYRELVKSDV